MFKPYVALACILLMSVSVSSQADSAQSTKLIASADAAFDRWQGTFSFEEYQAQLLQALGDYESALASIPADSIQTQSHVLNKLAQGYFELGMAYLDDRDEQEAAYGKGKDYALSSLRLDPAFVETEKKSFRAALQLASNVKAIFWYGNNLGRYLNFHPLTALSGGMKDVQASFARAIELDPTYLGGGPWRALGSFLAQVPAFLGGDPQQARAAFDAAIAIDPNYLENYVDDAEYVAMPEQNWDRFCRELGRCIDLADDPGIVAIWPLYNALTVQRARQLLHDHDCSG